MNCRELVINNQLVLGKKQCQREKFLQSKKRGTPMSKHINIILVVGMAAVILGTASVISLEREQFKASTTVENVQANSADHKPGQTGQVTPPNPQIPAVDETKPSPAFTNFLKTPWCLSTDSAF